MKTFASKAAQVIQRRCGRTHQFGFAVLMLACACLLPAKWARAQSQPPSLEGTYDVFDWSRSMYRPWTTFTIYKQSGDQFMIKGEGWEGHGIISWMGGSYDWIMKDGKPHHTRFVLGMDGSLEGSVIDPENPGPKYNWNFTATPRLKVMARSTKECDRVRNDAFPGCKMKGTAAEQWACANDAYVRWIACVKSTWQ